MKKFKSVLSVFLSLVLMLQVIVVPSVYGIAADTTNTDGNNKSYEAMLNSLDWFLAMNGFVFGSHGNVSKNNNVYTINLTIDVRDYYDWAKDESEDPMTFPLISRQVLMEHILFLKVLMK
ncbi:MAG: hypothetical protein LUG21_04840 [Clostridiales bacterium]|nr:hypothetical protein [Clostridiales bacterium]